MNTNGENAKKNSDELALLLTMKKRMLFLNEDDTPNFDCLLFGNFDGVSFECTSTWYDLAPTINMDEAALGINSEETKLSPYINSFILKLLFPTQKIDGFRYDLWKTLGQKDGKGNLEHPYVALIMFNLSKDFIINAGNQRKSEKCLFVELADIIKEEAGKDFKDLNCGLFPTYGYYDYILLVNTDSIHNVDKLCRALKYYKKNSMPILSACYTVFGIYNWNRACEDTGNYIHQIDTNSDQIKQIEIFLQIYPGKNINEFCKKFETETGLKPNICYTHGNADVIISVSNGKFGKLLHQYLKNDGCFNPGDSVYNKCILSTKTSFIFDKLENDDNYFSNQSNGKYEDPNGLNDRVPVKVDFVEANEQDSVLGDKEKNIIDVINRLKKVRDEHHRSQRLTTALRQTVQRYLNLTASDHSFVVKRLLDPVFQSLVMNMTCSLDLIEELTPQDGDASECFWECEALWKEFETALRAFRELVGGYISDITLSDKYFIEDSQLKHPSIGSATKLIFVYNFLVRSWVKEFNQGERLVYNFLVKSGGSDDICVTNLFNYLRMKQDKGQYVENCLLIIEIPERVLYNIPVSLYSIIHEVSHIVGDRKRSIRSHCLKRSVANIVACYIADDLIEGLKPSEIIETNLQKEYAAVLANCQKDLEKEILDVIYNSLAAESLAPDQSEDKLISRVYISELIKETTKVLTPSFRENSLLIKQIYILQHEKTAKLFESLYLKEMEKSRLRSRLLMFSKRMEEYKKSANKEKPYSDGLDKNAFELIYNDLNFLAGNTAGESEEYCVSQYIELCYAAMNECFSDCVAIKALGMPIEEYVACHCLTQEGLIENLLPQNAETVLRIGCVFEVAYGVQNSSDFSKHKTFVRKTINKIIKQKAFTFQMNPNGVIKQIEKLLDLCNESFGPNNLKQNITQYLGKTIVNYSTDSVNSQIIRVIRNLYGQWGKAGLKDEILNLWLNQIKGTE